MPSVVQRCFAGQSESARSQPNEGYGRIAQKSLMAYHDTPEVRQPNRGKTMQNFLRKPMQEKVSKMQRARFDHADRSGILLDVSA